MSTKFRWTPSSTGHWQRARWDGQTLTAELMRSIEGKMIVNVNDIREMRKSFTGLKIRRLGIKYQVGVPGGTRRAEKGELLIRSW